jgi:hypothetical protein
MGDPRLMNLWTSMPKELPKIKLENPVLIEFLLVFCLKNGKALILEK